MVAKEQKSSLKRNRIIKWISFTIALFVLAYMLLWGAVYLHLESNKMDTGEMISDILESYPELSKE